MKKLLVFLFCGLVLFVTTSFADLVTNRTNTTKVEALESDPTKYKKFSSSRTISILSSIILTLTNVTRKSPEDLGKIEYLNKQKEEYEILLRVHLAGEEMCDEYKKLALLSESNESSIDYGPTYENLCFLTLVIN
jgi:hypothetical protein